MGMTTGDPVGGRATLARHSRSRLKVAALLLLAMAAALLLLGGDEGLFQVLAKQRELEALRAQVASLEAANDSLRQVLWLLENDLGYVEKVAREEYGMVKPGERVYRLRPKARAGD